MRILIVEDDPSFTLIVRRLLEEAGFGVDEADTRESGRVLAMVHEYDAIVLDLGLPDGNGIPLIQALRRDGRHMPVLVVTGDTDPDSTVRALDAGADDYVTKPIVFDEFKARIRALVRRAGAQRTEQIAVGNVALDRLSRAVVVNGTAIKLTPRELSLLEHLLMRAGEVVTRAQLLSKVLDLDVDPGTNVLDVNVSRLRKKLSDAGATAQIESRRGIGFLMSAVENAEGAG